jgi:phosphoribosylaminoimidazolecarboxamide formyltransferase/IMP cyclohydrolase
LAAAAEKTSMNDPVISRALISVADKAGLVDFARVLVRRGIELLSTGGTAQALAAAGIAAKDIAEYTGFPELMDGRLKTLHPKVHGGLLAIPGNREHAAAAAAHAIAPIGLLVVNLYPFEEALAHGAAEEELIENIDIGGPAMLRAGAKNFAAVTVVVDPQDLPGVLAELENNGGATTFALRKALAAKAFARTAAYDAVISGWFAQRIGERTPVWRTFAGRLAYELRYGENPHQNAAFYVSGERRPGVASARQLQGKELSYNNLNDTDAAFELIGELGAEKPAVAIIKHANPCGVAQGETLLEAYRKALACDPISAFGGIIAVNKEIDAETARAIGAILTEVVIAPDASAEARAVFAAKKNLRLLTTGGLPDPRAPGLTFRSLAGGFLCQGRDTAIVDELELRVVTRRAPSARELQDMKFAFKVAKHVKSNAIVLAKDAATVGIGAGQMSRVDSARIAGLKAIEGAEAAGRAPPRDCVAASDAYFPFADGLLAAADAGASAVIQPGGSLRDAEVIEAADARGLAMVFTGVRHFRH